MTRRDFLQAIPPALAAGSGVAIVLPRASSPAAMRRLPPMVVAVNDGPMPARSGQVVMTCRFEDRWHIVAVEC